MIDLVRRSLNEADPLGLMALGAPEDEYDAYAKTLVEFMNEAPQYVFEDVRRVLSEELVAGFSEKLVDQASVTHAARLIWSSITQLN